MKDFFWFVWLAMVGILGDYQVDVDVGVNEVAVQGPADCSFYAHQTVLLSNRKLDQKLFTNSKLEISALTLYFTGYFPT